MIVPASNTNAEPDCLALAPPGNPARYPQRRLRRRCDSRFGRNAALFAPAAGRSTADAGRRAGRTDRLRLYLGDAGRRPEFDREFCAEIERKTGLPAVTLAGALVDALHAPGAPGRVHFALRRALNRRGGRVPRGLRPRGRQPARFRARTQQPRAKPTDARGRLSHGARRGSRGRRRAGDFLHRLPRARSRTGARRRARQNRWLPATRR